MCEEEVEADRESVTVEASEKDTEADCESVAVRLDDAVTKWLVGEKVRDTEGEADRELCGGAVLDQEGDINGDLDAVSDIKSVMLFNGEDDSRGDAVGRGDTEGVSERLLVCEEIFDAPTVADKRLLTVSVKLPQEEDDSRAELVDDDDDLDEVDARADREGTDDGASVAAADFDCVGGGPQVILDT